MNRKNNIIFVGYHDETRWRTETHRNSDGTTREEQHSYTEQVIDFDFAVDVSQYVSSTCTAMYVEPNKKTGETKTVRQLCDDYVKEKGKFKELEMRKSIDWNYKELTQGKSDEKFQSASISFEMLRFPSMSYPICYKASGISSHCRHNIPSSKQSSNSQMQFQGFGII